MSAALQFANTSALCQHGPWSDSQRARQRYSIIHRLALSADIASDTSVKHTQYMVITSAQLTQHVPVKSTCLYPQLLFKHKLTPHASHSLVQHS